MFDGRIIIAAAGNVIPVCGNGILRDAHAVPDRGNGMPMRGNDIHIGGNVMLTDGRGLPARGNGVRGRGPDVKWRENYCCKGYGR